MAGTTSANQGAREVYGAVSLYTPNGQSAMDDTLDAVKVTGTVTIEDAGGPITVDGTVAATQSGTWTVQPGNTANTTAWLVAIVTTSTASSPTTASIGASSATVISSNANRKGLCLTNTSTGGQRISLNFAAGSAVLDSGITLWPGDSFVMNERTFTTAQVNGIASAASGTIGVQEWT